MPRYQIIEISTGDKVYEYTADAPVAFQQFGWDNPALFNHVEIPPPPAPPPPSVYGGRRELSRLEFLRLLTQAERVAIRTAAKSNSTLEDFMTMMELADTVRLDNTDTITGLNTIEAVGLLAAGRASEILNG